MARGSKQPVDNTVHYDEFHPDPKVAARFSDRAANDTAAKHLAEDRKRVESRLADGGLDGNSRRALYVERDRIITEARRVGNDRPGIEERIKEVVS